MARKPTTYGDAREQANALLAQARLNDPDEHYPYKHAEMTALIAENPAMGPGIPGQLDGADDRSRTAEDYTSQGIADASETYIATQAAYLQDPTDETKGAYDTARDELIAARLDHRQNRGDGFTVGAAARRAG